MEIINIEFYYKFLIIYLIMSSIHFVGGEKGGVGKSFFAKTLVQWHLDNNVPLLVYEGDRSNPDVMRCYKSTITCKAAIYSEGERYEDKANDVYNSAIKKRVVVNLPAQVMKPVSDWIFNNELFEIAQEDGVKFYQWFVSDGGYDSINLFKKTLSTFSDGMTHLFVQNYGRTDDWSGIEDDEELQEMMENYNVMVLGFPKLIGAADRNRIDRESLTFGTAREWKKFGSISRQRVKRFLREAYEEIEATNVLMEESFEGREENS